MHVTTFKVRFGELDPYNHVNHAVYVAWFEAGRGEALASIGMSLGTMAEQGFQIVVTDLAVKYRQPALGSDVVEVQTWVSEIGGARSTWTQEIRRVTHEPAALLCSAEVRAGSTDTNGQPIRMPSTLRAALAQLERRT
jgi:acyl-CoA thioester hydrolase